MQSTDRGRPSGARARFDGSSKIVTSRPPRDRLATRPLAVGVVIVAAVLATALPLALGAQVDAAYAIATKVLLSGLAVALLTWFGWWRRAGFVALPSREDLPALALPGLLAGASLVAVLVAGPVPMEPALVIAFAAVAVGTGFSEEALFRGVLLESMRPSGPGRAIIGTTAAFAVTHFAGLAAGATLEATVVQVLFAGIPVGLGFAALRLAGRSIWPLVVIHTVNNFGSYLTTARWEASVQDPRFAIVGLIQLAFLLVLAMYGADYIRRQRRRSSVAVAAPA